MALLDIKYYPDPVLRVRCAEVASVNHEIIVLLDNMLETMYHAQGIGLAASQVGDKRRVIVVDVTKDDETRQPYQIINPEIIGQSDDLSDYEEGCLSIPDFYGLVKRPRVITLRYLDKKGDTQTIEADGLLATCIQHEIDHLNGIMFFDHLSKLKRDMLIKKFLKQQKEHIES